MNTKEIINTVAMYNRIMSKLLACKRHNDAQRATGRTFDPLWLYCKKNNYTTNDCNDIILVEVNEEENDVITCDSLIETAAKFTELCLAVGCSPSDIYTGY